MHIIYLFPTIHPLSCNMQTTRHNLHTHNHGDPLYTHLYMMVHEVKVYGYSIHFVRLHDNHPSKYCRTKTMLSICWTVALLYLLGTNALSASILNATMVEQMDIHTYLFYSMYIKRTHLCEGFKVVICFDQ